ncbi:MAG: hypothetical protein KDH15_22195 [Rhodocyclaceae bacterium]|nr:hypothetical protein [Rhodocyclaceae bacterium]
MARDRGDRAAGVAGSARGRSGEPGAFAANARSVPAQADGCWSVWRLDDNGNAFRVAGGLSRDAAEAMVRAYEAKGHKQCYWTCRQNVQADGVP